MRPSSERSTPATSNACGHLCDIRRRMKIVSFLQLPIETLGEQARHR